MNSIDKICAIVVTYNRKKLLIECLNGILSQTKLVDAIYLIDNASEDNTPELLKEKDFIAELPPSNIKEPWEKEFKLLNNISLYYVRMHENSGGAGGFHEGVKRAYNRGFDWYWLMDDDGVPDKNCLKTLFKYRDRSDFISPIVIDINKRDTLSFGFFDYKNKKFIKRLDEIQEEVYYKSANPFNGTLLSKKLVSKVGFPKKELFIWGDETEYMLRTLKNNMTVLTVSNAKHYHPTEKAVKLKLFLRYEIDWQDSKLGLYCRVRNRVYLDKYYFNNDSYKRRLIKYIIAFLLFKISFNDLITVFKATIDGIYENWGEERKYLR